MKPTNVEISDALVQGWLNGLTDDQRSHLSHWDADALGGLIQAALDGDIAFMTNDGTIELPDEDLTPRRRATPTDDEDEDL